MIDKRFLQKLIDRFRKFETELFKEMNHSHSANKYIQSYLQAAEKIHKALNQLSNSLKFSEKQQGVMFKQDNTVGFYQKHLIRMIKQVIHDIDAETRTLEKTSGNQKDFTFRPSDYDTFKYKLALRNELLKMKKQLVHADDVHENTKKVM